MSKELKSLFLKNVTKGCLAKMLTRPLMFLTQINQAAYDWSPQSLAACRELLYRKYRQPLPPPSDDPMQLGPDGRLRYYHVDPSMSDSTTGDGIGGDLARSSVMNRVSD